MPNHLAERFPPLDGSRGRPEVHGFVSIEAMGETCRGQAVSAPCTTRRRSSMVEHLPSKQDTRVRFPSPAPGSIWNPSPFLLFLAARKDEKCRADLVHPHGAPIPGCRQAVRHGVLAPISGGSIPSIPATCGSRHNYFLSDEYWRPGKTGSALQSPTRLQGALIRSCNSAGRVTDF